MGAVVIIDTPGLDDNTTLGKERMARTSKMLDRTDIAVVLFTDEGIDTGRCQTHAALLSLDLLGTTDTHNDAPFQNLFSFFHFYINTIGGICK